MSGETSIDRNKLGVGLFILSEANFFLLLIIAYVYYHAQSGGGPTAASSLNPMRAGVYTICLIASSFTMMLAARSAKHEAPAMLSAWLLATVALGAIFLFGQAREYLGLISQDVTISRDLFGTTFFTLTGFHGLHVFIGLIALATLAGLALGGALRGRNTVAIETVGMYWHFVDGVWVLIFAIVYLGAIR